MLSHLSNIVFAIIGTFIAFGDIEYPEEDDQLIGTVHLFIILRLIFYGSILLVLVGHLTKCVIS